MMNSNTYETDNLDNIRRQLTIHFSKDEQLKNTKKNIIKICFNDILNKLCFPLQNNDIVLDYRYFKFIFVQKSFQIFNC